MDSAAPDVNFGVRKHVIIDGKSTLKLTKEEAIMQKT